MPELPETETIARDLDAAIRSARVVSVDVARADVLRETDAQALPRAVTGAVITGVARRAKSIVMDLGASGRLVCTPRFTGALLLDGTPDPRYTCLTFDLEDGRRLRYHDVRRLGTVAHLDASGYARWDWSLGPEPLDPALTAARFADILRGSTRAVKTLLMDQRRLAGVGNIYANEALWHARIRPATRGTRLSHAAAHRLLDALQLVLRDSIALRGTTFRDFRDAYGGRGGYAARLAAYGRGGLPCLRCGATLRATHALEGRQTVWCPVCQR
ncbi:MAG: bifunctional DNA-formamidopyrimidine glycosylase/DNA-(apurinic or apyrimidinic site) lyase [Gemmatimonadota bacterium]